MFSKNNAAGIRPLVLKKKKTRASKQVGRVAGLICVRHLKKTKQFFRLRFLSYSVHSVCLELLCFKHLHNNVRACLQSTHGNFLTIQTHTCYSGLLVSSIFSCTKKKKRISVHLSKLSKSSTFSLKSYLEPERSLFYTRMPSSEF